MSVQTDVKRGKSTCIEEGVHRVKLVIDDSRGIILLQSLVLSILILSTFYPFPTFVK